MKTTLSICKGSSSHLTLALIAVAALSVLPFNKASAQVIINDNFSTDTLASYFRPTSSGDVTYSATGGVNGGGGLLIANVGNASVSLIPDADNLAGNNTAFTFAQGAQIQMSMMLRYSGSSGGTSQAFLGLSTDQDYSWGNSVTNTALGSAAISGFNLTTRGGTGGGIGNNSTGVTNFSLTSGNWYLHNVTLTKPTTGNNLWSFAGSLQDFGATGIVAGSVLGSYTGVTGAFGTTADTGINAAATNTFLNFGVREQMWTAADNFTASVVPEPSTYALLGLGLGALFLLRRRKA